MADTVVRQLSAAARTAVLAAALLLLLGLAPAPLLQRGGGGGGSPCRWALGVSAEQTDRQVRLQWVGWVSGLLWDPFVFPVQHGHRLLPLSPFSPSASSASVCHLPLSDCPPCHPTPHPSRLKVNSDGSLFAALTNPAIRSIGVAHSGASLAPYAQALYNAVGGRVCVCVCVGGGVSCVLSITHTHTHTHTPTHTHAHTRASPPVSKRRPRSPPRSFTLGSV